MSAASDRKGRRLAAGKGGHTVSVRTNISYPATCSPHTGRARGRPADPVRRCTLLVSLSLLHAEHAVRRCESTTLGSAKAEYAGLFPRSLVPVSASRFSR